jgi:putative phosphoesterase
MKIGLLSDTHGHLDPKIFDHFDLCDEVWHAGDIGDETVANRLATFKPLRAVFGNIDDKSLQARFPEDLFFTCEEIKVWITHIGGFPPNYNPRVKKMLLAKLPQIFICGHSHILRIVRDANYKNLLYINPGAAGNQGFHRKKTVVRFEITGKEIKNMEVIELGLRGAI